jgi:hypothetical protein
MTETHISYEQIERETALCELVAERGRIIQAQRRVIEQLQKELASMKEINPCEELP